MKKILFLALLGCAVLATTAVASTTETGPKPWDSDEDGAPPATITQSVRLVIAEIGDDGSIVLTNDSKALFEIRLDDKVALRAKRKKDFGGRRKLAFSDLAPGQLIKLTYMTESRRVLRIDVLEKTARS